MRNIYSMALATMALSSLSNMEAMSHISVMPQSPSSGVPNYHRKIRRSRYTPHQGKRECDRRIRQGLCPAS
jgi:hypothetical protein